MQELIVNIAPNLASKLPDFYKALGDTMLMVLWSGLISFVFGLLLGVVLTVTKPNGILENHASGLPSGAYMRNMKFVSSRQFTA